jgi:dUTP pyrophosphatase
MEYAVTFYKELQMILPGQTIRKLINNTPHLVDGFIDMESQLQPNGFDLTVRQVASLNSPGKISSGKQRELSSTTEIKYDESDWVHLPFGVYLITYNEVVTLPSDIMALGRPRSSLLRCGVSVGTAIWDAGYSGRSQSLLVVHNSMGFDLQRNTRVMQLVFVRLEGDTETLYNGLFQHENT